MTVTAKQILAAIDRAADEAETDPSSPCHLDLFETYDPAVVEIRGSVSFERVAEILNEGVK